MDRCFILGDQPHGETQHAAIRLPALECHPIAIGARIEQNVRLHRDDAGLSALVLKAVQD